MSGFHLPMKQAIIWQDRLTLTQEMLLILIMYIIRTRKNGRLPCQQGPLLQMSGI